MIDFETDAASLEVRAPIRNTARYVAVWGFEIVSSGLFAIRSLKVRDQLGFNPEIVITDTDSQWEGTAQINEIGHAPDLTQDMFVAFRHNAPNQQPISHAFVADGVTVTQSANSLASFYIFQKHSVTTPLQSTPAGDFTHHHIFLNDEMIMQMDWNFLAGIEQRVSYGVQCPVSPKAPFGLSNCNIEGQESVSAIGDDAFHFASVEHNPASVVFSSDVHRFQLVIEHPIGLGRLPGGEPTAEFADIERAFLQDSGDPTNVLKYRQAFSSGSFRPALNSNHITRFRVELSD